MTKLQTAIQHAINCASADGTVRRWTIKQGQRMNGIQVSAKGKDIECGWDHLFRSLRKKLSTPKRTLA